MLLHHLIQKTEQCHFLTKTHMAGSVIVQPVLSNRQCPSRAIYIIEGNRDDSRNGPFIDTLSWQVSEATVIEFLPMVMMLCYFVTNAYPPEVVCGGRSTPIFSKSKSSDASE